MAAFIEHRSAPERTAALLESDSNYSVENSLRLFFSSRCDFFPRLVMQKHIFGIENILHHKMSETHFVVISHNVDETEMGSLPNTE